MNWSEYQEQSASFFRSLGLEAETNVTLKDVRTEHDIDVLVRSCHAGFDIKWLVECKYWGTKVSKLHVLALREIVNDTGADRGILLAENGFQSGAIEAANLTNVHVSSLAEITKTASQEIFSMQLRDLHELLTWCKEQYWSIPKIDRIAWDLRPSSGGYGYSGSAVIAVCEELLMSGFRGAMPVISNRLHVPASKDLLERDMPTSFDSLKSLIVYIDQLLRTLERKINKCVQHQLEREG